jgi:hypothetical protein
VTTEESFEELADLGELFPGGAYGPGGELLVGCGDSSHLKKS